MSRRPSTSPTKMRGPSRPVDPRRAPGPRPKRGLDRFGIALIGVSTAVALLVILYVATLDRGATGTSQTPLDPTTNLPRISAAEALALHNANSADIIDVRAATSYQARHISGARNIPYTEMEARFSEVPKQGNVILYCQ